MKKGDRVRVTNTTLGGKPFFEGWATVVRLIGKPEGGSQRALVHFDDDDESPEMVVERRV
jgi:uncharacterized protein (DUF433 family)